MKNRISLKEYYYFDFCINIFFGIILLFGFIIIIIIRDSLINIWNQIFGYILFCGIHLILLVAIIFESLRIIKFIKDYPSLKNEKYEIIIGKVMGFRRNEDADSGVQINNFPIIENQENNEIIVLKTNEILKINEIYNFKYLKNTKIAALKNN